MASRSISRKLRQIIDLRDTEKSRYFAITEFNNCFIILSPSFFLNKYLREAKRSAILDERAIARRRKAWFRLRVSRILLSAKHLKPNTVGLIAHEHTIICRELFTGQVVGVRPIQRKKNLYRMIITFITYNTDFLQARDGWNSMSSI